MFTGGDPKPPSQTPPQPPGLLLTQGVVVREIKFADL